MLNKINVTAIVKDHIATLENYHTGRVHYPDIFLFFIFPLIISLFLVLVNVLLNDSMANALITSFSVFAALLFNLLLLIYDISGKSSDDTVDQRKQESRKEVLRQLYINISFSIFISVVAVVFLIIYFLKIKKCVLIGFNICSLPPFLSLAVYYISALFILTLLMILKRIYILLSREFDV